MCGIEKKNEAKAEKLCVVALWCTQQKFHERKDMSSVVKMLQGEIPLEKPPNPFPFYDSSPESSMFGGHRQLPKFSPAFTKGRPEESALERAEVSTHQKSGSSSTPRTASKSTPIDLKRKSLKFGLSNTSPEENALLPKERNKDYKDSDSSKPRSLLVDGIPKVQERHTNRKPNETETRSSEGSSSIQRELNEHFKEEICFSKNK